MNIAPLQNVLTEASEAVANIDKNLNEAEASLTSVAHVGSRVLPGGILVPDVLTVWLPPDPAMDGYRLGFTTMGLTVNIGGAIEMVITSPVSVRSWAHTKLQDLVDALCAEAQKYIASSKVQPRFPG